MIAGLGSLSLLARWQALEPMWRLNPRAQKAFGLAPTWAGVFLIALCAACAAAAAGIWFRRRWGHRLATVLVATNLAGDFFNGVTGVEPRALAGVPVAIALLFYLRSRNVRHFFARRAAADSD